jgi:hypothetical protein
VVVAQPQRQMIEQGLVDRRQAGAAEVLLGFHDAGAEQLGPQAVRQHAGGQRVVVAGEPACHVEAG